LKLESSRDLTLAAAKRGLQVIKEKINAARSIHERLNIAATASERAAQELSSEVSKVAGAVLSQDLNSGAAEARSKTRKALSQKKLAFVDVPWLWDSPSASVCTNEIDEDAAPMAKNCRVPSKSAAYRRTSVKRRFTMRFSNDIVTGEYEEPSADEFAAARDYSQSLQRADLKQFYGFFVLEHLINIGGHRDHLLSRNALAMVGTNWMDLTLWAILMGHIELSYRVWPRCRELMRCALIAARLCQKLKTMVNAAFSEELEEAALRFESHAIGLLDQVLESNGAIDLLTLVPNRLLLQPRQKTRGVLQGVTERVTRFTTRRSASSRHASDEVLTDEASQAANKPPPGGPSAWVPLWSGSVLDTAMSTPHPCRRFVAHRHCAYVRDLHMSGFHRGSQCAVPSETSILRLFVQCCIHPFGLRVCNVIVPCFPSVLDATTERQLEERRLEAHAEMDEDYFAQSARRCSRQPYPPRAGPRGGPSGRSPRCITSCTRSHR